MAKLSTKERSKLPDSDFAGPNRSFPIQDANHRRAAQMLDKNASSATKAKINKAVAKKGK